MVEQEKVYCLIRENPETGKFETPEDTKHFLSTLGPNPIAVISIAGAYRQGKSFLVNRVVLKQKKGFEIGGTVNACTKGIWISSKVITKDFEGKDIMYNGKPMQILVADTEGLASTEVD